MKKVVLLLLACSVLLAQGPPHGVTLAWSWAHGTEARVPASTSSGQSWPADPTCRSALLQTQQGQALLKQITDAITTMLQAAPLTTK